MSAPFQGGCVCEKIRYECTAEPMLSGHCHCRDCQMTSGGQMSTVVIVPRSEFKLSKGEPKSYPFTAHSGNKLNRQFCGDCGTPLFTELEAMPDAWIIKAASLDDPSWLEPSMHIFTDSAQPWAHIPQDMEQHGKMPPM